jgi:predicted nucleic acid-binding protein
LTEVWIINASPVITLAKAGYLHLLDQLAIELLIPSPVVAEILAGPPEDPARKAIESGWGHVLSPPPTPEIILEWGLGAGESSVLASSLAQPGRTAVLDDAAARTCARTLGVPYLGTLAIILHSKKAGFLESAATAMLALRQAGLRLDDRTLRRALEQIGESWAG